MSGSCAFEEETVSKLENPPLRPGVVGSAGPHTGLQNPPLGRSGRDAGLQNPPLGPGIAGGAGLQNPPLGFVMEPQRLEYKGHRIELRARAQELELLIDDQPIRYRPMSDGTYALDEYAYDRSQNLIDVAKRFIDYRDRADEIRKT